MTTPIRVMVPAFYGEQAASDIDHFFANRGYDHTDLTQVDELTFDGVTCRVYEAMVTERADATPAQIGRRIPRGEHD